MKEKLKSINSDIDRYEKMKNKLSAEARNEVEAEVLLQKMNERIYHQGTSIELIWRRKRHECIRIVKQ